MFHSLFTLALTITSAGITAYFVLPSIKRTRKPAASQPVNPPVTVVDDNANADWWDA